MRRAAFLAALLLSLAGCHDDGGGGQSPADGGGESRVGLPDAPGGLNGQQQDEVKKDAGSGEERQGEGEEREGEGEEREKEESPKDPTQVSAEKTIGIVIDAVLTSGEPLLACDLYVTPRYLRTAYGGRDGCTRAQGEKATADSVAVKSVNVKGEDADAVAVPSGGASDGERLEITLVRQGGAWRIDRVRSDAPVGP
jgi:hypothetical protein